MNKQTKRTRNKTYSEDLFKDLFENSPIPYLISRSREGIKFSIFNKLVNGRPFTMKDWANYLHLSETTLQRYKKENIVFEPFKSEKIIQITLLQKKGGKAFGDKEKFNQWMETTIAALGGVKPKELIDSSYGVDLVNDELGRIEYGELGG